MAMAGASANTASTTPQSFDWIAYRRRVAERQNRRPGPLTGYDCPDCLNRGYTSGVDGDGNEFARVCPCMDIRDAARRMERSGLGEAVKRCTFDLFDAGEDWQASIKRGAMAYADAIKAGAADWLYIAGQPGCGKTHLCTAVCGELLASGKRVRYMLWVDAAAKIKAARTDPEAMDELLEPLKTVDVLYIDDLLKGMREVNGRLTATEADVRLCFEILNARWVARLPTVISCEWYLVSDLMDVDEATFSRVYQASSAFRFEISRGAVRNYRLAGGAG